MSFLCQQLLQGRVLYETALLLNVLDLACLTVRKPVNKISHSPYKSFVPCPGAGYKTVSCCNVGHLSVSVLFNLSFLLPPVRCSPSLSVSPYTRVCPYLTRDICSSPDTILPYLLGRSVEVAYLSISGLILS